MGNSSAGTQVKHCLRSGPDTSGNAESRPVVGALLLSGNGSIGSRPTKLFATPARLCDLQLASGSADPLQEKGVTCEPGISGQAARFAPGSRLRFAEEGNLNKEQGTISLWFRPDFSGQQTYRERGGEIYARRYFINVVGGLAGQNFARRRFRDGTYATRSALRRVGWRPTLLVLLINRLLSTYLALAIPQLGTAKRALLGRRGV